MARRWRHRRTPPRLRPQVDRSARARRRHPVRPRPGRPSNRCSPTIRCCTCCDVRRSVRPTRWSPGSRTVASTRGSTSSSRPSRSTTAPASNASAAAPSRTGRSTVRTRSAGSPTCWSPAPGIRRCCTTSTTRTPATRATKRPCRRTTVASCWSCTPSVSTAATPRRTSRTPRSSSRAGPSTATRSSASTPAATTSGPSACSTSHTPTTPPTAAWRSARPTSGTSPATLRPPRTSPPSWRAASLPTSPRHRWWTSSRRPISTTTPRSCPCCVRCSPATSSPDRSARRRGDRWRTSWRRPAHSD